MSIHPWTLRRWPFVEPAVAEDVGGKRPQINRENQALDLAHDFRTLPDTEINPRVEDEQAEEQKKKEMIQHDEMPFCSRPSTRQERGCERCANNSENGEPPEDFLIPSHGAADASPHTDDNW